MLQALAYCLLGLCVVLLHQHWLACIIIELENL
jgi:hypothetical protein